MKSDAGWISVGGESTGVVSAVSQLSSGDFYGGVAVFQFILKMKNASFELFILTCSTTVIVMFAALIEENLLTTFLPVKRQFLDVLLGVDGAGQHGVTSFLHGDDNRPWKKTQQVKEQTHKQTNTQTSQHNLLTTVYGICGCCFVFGSHFIKIY